MLSEHQSATLPEKMTSSHPQVQSHTFRPNHQAATQHQTVQLNRNFRTSYYKSLGVRVGSSAHGGALQLSFSQILSDTVINRTQLIRLGLQYGVPSALRPLVWKIVLNVISIYRDTWSFSEVQLQDNFADLERACILLDLTSRRRRTRTRSSKGRLDQRISKPPQQSLESGTKEKIFESELREPEQEHPCSESSSSPETTTRLYKKLGDLGQILAAPTFPSSQHGSRELNLQNLLRLHNSKDDDSYPIERIYLLSLGLINLKEGRRGMAKHLKAPVIDEVLLAGLANVFKNVFDARYEAYWCFAACIDILSQDLQVGGPPRQQRPPTPSSGSRTPSSASSHFSASASFATVSARSTPKQVKGMQAVPCVAFSASNASPASGLFHAKSMQGTDTTADNASLASGMLASSVYSGNSRDSEVFPSSTIRQAHLGVEELERCLFRLLSSASPES